ncbi:MAG: BLUF domain-containing protein [Alphaproteobacteria bacterium]|nr:BLUF domain-containing protein [Alphaproteobacteria bacterium]
MLVRCLYASRPAKLMTSALIDEILKQSCANNPGQGITGLLSFTNEVFVQVMEGGRDEICKLFNAIVRDERNKDVCLLVYEEIKERHFGNWTMGQVKLEGINPGVMLKYYEKAEFNPFNAPGHATMSLMMELVATGAIVSRVGA